MLDVAGFRAIYPEFSDDGTWPSTTIQAALTRSATFVGETEWGTYYNEATAAWVADRLVVGAVLATKGAAASMAGTETLRQVRDVMVQNASDIIKANMADPYLRTSYGQFYRNLQQLQFGGTTLAGDTGVGCP